MKVWDLLSEVRSVLAWPFLLKLLESVVFYSRTWKCGFLYSHANLVKPDPLPSDNN